MSIEIWNQCIRQLRDELLSQQFNTWVRVLQLESVGKNWLFTAPNRFVRDWVIDHYLERMLELLQTAIADRDSTQGLQLLDLSGGLHGRGVKLMIFRAAKGAKYKSGMKDLLLLDLANSAAVTVH